MEWPNQRAKMEEDMEPHPRMYDLVNLVCKKSNKVRDGIYRSTEVQLLLKNPNWHLGEGNIGLYRYLPHNMNKRFCLDVNIKTAR